MNDDRDVESLLRRYRPAEPPTGLRARVVEGAAERRRAWPWIAAAAALLALTVGLHMSTARVGHRMRPAEDFDERAAAIVELERALGDGDAARERVAQVMRDRDWARLSEGFPTPSVAGRGAAMTGNIQTPVRVRPGLRRVAVVIFALLLPLAVHSLWDYIEARRLSRAVEDIRQRGERLHFGKEREGRPITPEQMRASRYYAAAAHLVRDTYGKAFGAATQDIDAVAVLGPAKAKEDRRLETLRQLAEQYDPALDLLDRAAHLDARGLDYGDELRYGLPNKSLADLNALRVARLAFLGESRMAAEALVSTSSDPARVCGHLLARLVRRYQWQPAADPRIRAAHRRRVADASKRVCEMGRRY